MDILAWTAFEVGIVELVGRLSLGGDAVELRDAVRRLLSERRKSIILNLPCCTYIDSAGLGELVGSFTDVSIAGGRIVLCNVSKRVQDLLQITKLYSIFTVVPTIRDGLYELNASGVEGAARRLYISCPLHACGSWVSVADPIGATGRGDCGACDTQFLYHRPVDLKPSETQATALGLKIPSYENDFVDLKLTEPAVIQITRLDLFSFQALNKAWLSLPAPRRVVVDLTWTREATEVGLAAAVALWEHATDGSRAVMLVTKEDSVSAIILRRPDIHKTWQKAVEALGEQPPGTAPKVTLTLSPTAPLPRTASPARVSGPEE